VGCDNEEVTNIVTKLYFYTNIIFYLIFGIVAGGVGIGRGEVQDDEDGAGDQQSEG
jgi:hypothetical protein